MKYTNTLCVILAVILVIILIRAATNQGRLWGGEENYRADIALDCIKSARVLFPDFCPAIKIQKNIIN